MIVVREHRLLASLVVLALVVGPASVSAADLLDTDVSAENVTEGSIEEATEDYDLIGPRQASSSIGEPAVTCEFDLETHELLCEPSEDCQPSTDDCRAPSDCEAEEDGRYRCLALAGRGPPDHAKVKGDSSKDASGDNGTAASSSSASSSSHERGASNSQDQDEEAHEPENTSGEEAEADCEPGPERGTLVCEPPAACEDLLSQVEACTLPSHCQASEAETYRCVLPDRQRADQEEVAGANDTTAGDSAALGPDASEEELFGHGAEARAEARAAIADSLGEQTEAFGSELATMRTDYEAAVDELRRTYEEDKDDLRADYRDCLAQTPEDADASQRTDELSACLEQAREGLASLRAQVQSEHATLADTFAQRAEEARQASCQQTEQAAIEAIAQRGLFAINPGDLLPADALELCPSFADFQPDGDRG